MRLGKPLVVLVLLLVPVLGSMGCARALQDGVSIGLTDGLSSGIAQVLSELITSFNASMGM